MTIRRRTIICLLTSLFILCTPLNIRASYADAFTYHTYTAADITLPYRLYIPEHGEDEALPLVIFLHGAGARGDDNEYQLFDGAIPYMMGGYLPENEKAVILAPQCPDGTQWVLTPWADGAYSTDEVPLSPSLDAVMKIASQLCRSENIDMSRLYITGLSMGGFGTWDIITRYPNVFAAAVPVCGSGDPSKGDVLAASATKILTVHGTADPVVPYSGTQQTVDAIRAAGGSVEFFGIEGGRHDAWNPTYSDRSVFEWMFGHRLTDTTEAERVMGTEKEAETGAVNTESAAPDPNTAGVDHTPLIVVAVISIIGAITIAAAKLSKKQ